MKHSPRTAEDCKPVDTAEDCEPSWPAVAVDTLFYAHPALLPLRSYALTCREDLVMRHEGRGLTLDRVLALECNPPAHGGDDSFYDEAVWEGNRVVAVLRYSGNGVETIRIAPAKSEGGGN